MSKSICCPSAPIWRSVNVLSRKLGPHRLHGILACYSAQRLTPDPRRRLTPANTAEFLEPSPAVHHVWGQCWKPVGVRLRRLFTGNYALDPLLKRKREILLAWLEWLEKRVQEAIVVADPGLLRRRRSEGRDLSRPIWQDGVGWPARFSAPRRRQIARSLSLRA